MFMTHPFPHKPVRVRAACDSCSLASQGAMPDPERRRMLGGKHKVPLRLIVDNYVKFTGVFSPILFFRIVACTCSALTMTMSSMLPWREVLQGGWLWRALRPRSGESSTFPGRGLFVRDSSLWFSQWVLFSELAHSVFGLCHWNNAFFFISFAHLWLCFMAAMKKERKFFLTLDFFDIF